MGDEFDEVTKEQDRSVFPREIRFEARALNGLNTMERVYGDVAILFSAGMRFAVFGE